MPSPILDALAAQVTATTDVMQSAKVLIDGIQKRLADAVTKALANGATAAELQPVQAEVDALKAKSDDLAAAVTANT